MKTVYVGMSGGVDSSVSALLLKEQGYNVVGVYMKNWSQDLPGMKCPWAEDLSDAKRVAVKLGIDFKVWDFEKDYREKVVEYMLREFKAGNTPNPDIMCNQEIKFKLFYEKAMEDGADYIATGHYARVDSGSLSSPDTLSDSDALSNPAASSDSDSLSDSRRSSEEISTPRLLRAIDENKDQTYFLYRISDEALSRTIFPIGGMTKPEVKKIAEKHGLHNAYKKESMGVCFVGDVGMKDFLKEYIEMKPGEIREAENGKVLGYHEGAIFYTIGQRHGLYLNGEKGIVNDGLPYYVVSKDLEKNTVYVSKNLNHEAIWTKELNLNNLILRGKYTLSDFAKNENLTVRLRHRAPLISVKFSTDKGQNSIEGAGKLIFESEIKRPASGQSAVLYDGEICVGGGIII